MKVNSEVLWIGAIAIAFLAVNEASHVFAHASPPANGWAISQSGRSDQARFSIDRSQSGSHSKWTTDFPWADFQDLNAERLAHLSGAHTFKFVRDALIFTCAGQFNDGSGQGTYTFETNPKFVAALEAMGYDSPNETDLFHLAFSGVSLEFATVVKEAGLNATTRELLDLRSHGVTAKDLRETRAAGFTNLSAKEYIELRNHGVPTEFLRELKVSGYDMTAHEIVELRDHGIDSKYVRDLAADKPLTREIIDLKNNGVDARFVNELRSMGYQFKVADIIKLRNHGVDTAYLLKLRDSGFETLSAEKIVKLRNHGVD